MGVMINYMKLESMSYLSQVRALRRLAYSALKQYPIKLKSLNFIQHGENTTFKVTGTKNEQYVLRIHRNYYSDEALKEELKWIEKLSKLEDMLVPSPLKTITNKYLAKAFFKEDQSYRKITLLNWIDGTCIRKSVNSKHIILLADLIARLHNHTKKFQSKHRPLWDAEGLIGKSPQFGKIDSIEGLKDSDFKFLDDSRKVLLKKIKKYEKRQSEKMGLIHADLHFGNLLFNKRTISPIDFDDCGTGFHMYDLAVISESLFNRIESKMITKKKYEELISLLIETYSQKINITQEDFNIVNDLKLARSFVILEWLNGRKDNPRLKEMTLFRAKQTIRHLKKVKF